MEELDFSPKPIEPAANIWDDFYSKKIASLRQPLAQAEPTEQEQIVARVTESFQEWSAKQAEAQMNPAQASRRSLNDFNPRPQDFETGVEDPNFLVRFSKSAIEGAIPLGLIKWGADKAGLDGVRSSIEGFTERPQADTGGEKFAEIAGGFVGTLAGFMLPMGLVSKVAGVFWKGSLATKAMPTLGKIGKYWYEGDRKREAVEAAARSAGLIRSIGGTAEATQRMSNYMRFMRETSKVDKFLFHAINDATRNAIALPLHAMIMADPKFNDSFKDYFDIGMLTQKDAAIFSAIEGITQVDKRLAIAAPLAAFAVGYGFSDAHEEMPQEDRVIQGLTFFAMGALNSFGAVKRLRKEMEIGLDDLGFPNADVLAKRVHERMTDPDSLPHLRRVLEDFGKKPAEVDAILADARRVGEAREAMAVKKAEFLESLKPEDVATDAGASAAAKRLAELDPDYADAPANIQEALVLDIKERLWTWGGADESADAARNMKNLRSELAAKEVEIAIESRRQKVNERMAEAEKNIGSPEAMKLLGEDVARIVAPEAKPEQIASMGAQIAEALEISIKTGTRGKAPVGGDAGKVYAAAVDQAISIGKKYRAERFAEIGQKYAPEELLSNEKSLREAATELWEAKNMRKFPAEGDEGSNAAVKELKKMEQAILVNGIENSVKKPAEQSAESVAAWKAAVDLRKEALRRESVRQERADARAAEAKKDAKKPKEKPPAPKAIPRARWDAVRKIEDSYVESMERNARERIAADWNRENPDRTITAKDVPVEAIKAQNIRDKARERVLRKFGFDPKEYPRRRPAAPPRDPVLEALEAASEQASLRRRVRGLRGAVNQRIYDAGLDIGVERPVPDTTILRIMLETGSQVKEATGLNDLINTPYGASLGIDPVAVFADRGGIIPTIGTAIASLKKSGMIEIKKSGNKRSSISITAKGMEALFSDGGEAFKGRQFISKYSPDPLETTPMVFMGKQGSMYVFREVGSTQDLRFSDFPRDFVEREAFNQIGDILGAPTALDIFGPGSRSLSKKFSDGQSELAGLTHLLIPEIRTLVSSVESARDRKLARLREAEGDLEPGERIPREEEISIADIGSEVSRAITGERKGTVSMQLAHGLAVSAMVRGGKKAKINHDNMTLSSRDTVLKAQGLELSLAEKTRGMKAEEATKVISAELTALANEAMVPLSAREIAIMHAKTAKAAKTTKEALGSARKMAEMLTKEVQDIYDLSRKIRDSDTPAAERLAAIEMIRAKFSVELEVYQAKFKSFADTLRKSGFEAEIEAKFSRAHWQTHMTPGLAEKLALHLRDLETSLVDKKSGRLVSEDIRKVIIEEIEIERNTRDIREYTSEGYLDSNPFGERLSEAISKKIYGEGGDLFSGGDAGEIRRAIMRFIDSEASDRANTKSLDELLESVDRAKVQERMAAAEADEGSAVNLLIQTAKDAESGDAADYLRSGGPGKFDLGDGPLGNGDHVERSIETLLSTPLPRRTGRAGGGWTSAEAASSRPEGPGQAGARMALERGISAVEDTLKKSGIPAASIRDAISSLYPGRARGSDMGVSVAVEVASRIRPMVDRVAKLSADADAARMMIKKTKEGPGGGGDAALRRIQSELDETRAEILNEIKRTAEDRYGRNLSNDIIDIDIGKYKTFSRETSVENILRDISDYVTRVAGPDAAPSIMVRLISDISRNNKLRTPHVDTWEGTLRFVQEQMMDSEGVATLNREQLNRAIIKATDESKRAFEAIKLVVFGLRMAGADGAHFRSIGSGYGSGALEAASGLMVAKGAAPEVSILDMPVYSAAASKASEAFAGTEKMVAAMELSARKAAKRAKTPEERSLVVQMLRSAQEARNFIKAQSKPVRSAGDSVLLRMPGEPRDFSYVTASEKAAVKEIKRIAGVLGIKTPRVASMTSDELARIANNITNDPQARAALIEASGAQKHRRDANLGHKMTAAEKFVSNMLTRVRVESWKRKVDFDFSAELDAARGRAEVEASRPRVDVQKKFDKAMETPERKVFRRNEERVRNIMMFAERVMMQEPGGARAIERRAAKSIAPGSLEKDRRRVKALDNIVEKNKGADGGNQFRRVVDKTRLDAAKTELETARSPGENPPGAPAEGMASPESIRDALPGNAAAERLVIYANVQRNNGLITRAQAAKLKPLLKSISREEADMWKSTTDILEKGVSARELYKAKATDKPSKADVADGIQRDLDAAEATRRPAKSYSGEKDFSDPSVQQKEIVSVLEERIAATQGRLRIIAKGASRQQKTTIRNAKLKEIKNIKAELAEQKAALKRIKDMEAEGVFVSEQRTEGAFRALLDRYFDAPMSERKKLAALMDELDPERTKARAAQKARVSGDTGVTSDADAGPANRAGDAPAQGQNRAGADISENEGVRRVNTGVKTRSELDPAREKIVRKIEQLDAQIQSNRPEANGPTANLRKARAAAVRQLKKLNAEIKSARDRARGAEMPEALAGGDARATLWSKLSAEKQRLQESIKEGASKKDVDAANTRIAEIDKKLGKFRRPDKRSLERQARILKDKIADEEANLSAATTSQKRPIELRLQELRLREKLVSAEVSSKSPEAPVQAAAQKEASIKDIEIDSAAIVRAVSDELNPVDKNFRVARAAANKILDGKKITAEERAILAEYRVEIKNKKYSMLEALERVDPSRLSSFDRRLQVDSAAERVTPDVMQSQINASAKRIGGSVSGDLVKDGTVTVTKAGRTIEYTLDSALDANGEVRQLVRDGKVVGWKIRVNPGRARGDTIFHEGSEGHIAWDFMSPAERKAISKFFGESTEEGVVQKLAMAISKGEIASTPTPFISRLIQRAKEFVESITGGRLFSGARGARVAADVASGKIVSRGGAPDVASERFQRTRPASLAEFRQQYGFGSPQYKAFLAAFQKRGDRSIKTLSQFYSDVYNASNKLKNRQEEFRQVISSQKAFKVSAGREFIAGITSKNETLETLTARLGLDDIVQKELTGAAVENAARVDNAGARFLQKNEKIIRDAKTERSVAVTDSTGARVKMQRGQMLDIALGGGRSAMLENSAVWAGIKANNWASINAAIAGQPKEMQASIRRNIAKIAGVLSEKQGEVYKKNPDGSIMLDPTMAKEYWTGSQMAKFSANDVKKMHDASTPQDVAFYEKVVRPYYDEVLWPELAKEYKAVTGKELTPEYGYVMSRRLWSPDADPATRQNAQTVTERRAIDDLQYRLLQNMPATKARGYSAAPIIAHNLAHSLAAARREVSHYVGYTRPVSEIRSALEGNKLLMYEKIGKERSDTIFNILGRLEGNVQRVGRLEQGANEMLNRFATATLGLNPAIALYQPLSIASYARYFGAGNTTKAMAMRATPEGKRLIKEIVSESQALQQRFMRRLYQNDILDTSSGGAEIRGIVGGRASRAGAIDLMMRPIDSADKFAVRTGVLAAYFKGKELGLSGKALIKYAAEQGAIATHNTQSSSLDIARNEWRASPQMHHRALSFMTSGINAGYNMVLRDIIKARQSGWTDKTAVRNLAASTAAIAIATFGVTSIRTYKDYIAADEDRRKELAKQTNRMMYSFASDLAGHLPGSAMYANAAVGTAARILGDHREGAQYQALESRNPYDMGYKEFIKFQAAFKAWSDGRRGYSIDSNGKKSKISRKEAKEAHNRLVKHSIRLVELSTGLSGLRAFEQLEGLTR